MAFVFIVVYMVFAIHIDHLDTYLFNVIKCQLVLSIFDSIHVFGNAVQFFISVSFQILLGSMHASTISCQFNYSSSCDIIFQ